MDNYKPAGWGLGQEASTSAKHGNHPRCRISATTLTRRISRCYFLVSSALLRSAGQAGSRHTSPEDFGPLVCFFFFKFRTYQGLNLWPGTCYTSTIGELQNQSFFPFITIVYMCVLQTVHTCINALCVGVCTCHGTWIKDNGQLFRVGCLLPVSVGCSGRIQPGSYGKCVSALSHIINLQSSKKTFLSVCSDAHAFRGQGQL